MAIYCVYLTLYHGNKLPPFYIGSTSIGKILNGYHGSVRSKEFRKIWENEILNNPHLFKTKIISTHNDRKEALDKEYKLQKLLKVVKSTMYINKSFAAPNGFFGMSMSGELHWGYMKSRPQQTKDLISKNHHDCTGAKNSRARNINIISPDGVVYTCHGNFEEMCIQLKLPVGTMMKLLHENQIPKSGKCVGWKAEHTTHLP